MPKIKRPLDANAVNIANTALIPQTGGRLLFMGSADYEFRKKWAKTYHAALHGEGNRGSLGTVTNCQSINPGTLAKTNQIPQGPKVVTAPMTLNYFDIKTLLPVCTALGWKMGRNFMDFWSKGVACTADNDDSLSPPKATIGANVSNSCVRIYELDWDWILKYKLAKSKYELFIREKIFNVAAKNSIIRAYGGLVNPAQTAVTFGDWLKDDLSPKVFRDKIEDHQRQYLSVEPGIFDPENFNDLIAALNNFSYYSMYKGKTFHGDIYKKKPTSVNLQGISSELNSSEFQKLADGNYKALIYVSHVGIYVGDIYEFNGTQYLGNWNMNTNTVKSSYWDRLFSSPNDEIEDSNNLAIHNGTFRIYRTKSGMGGDFIALTPIKLIYRPMLIPVPR